MVLYGFGSLSTDLVMFHVVFEGELFSHFFGDLTILLINLVADNHEVHVFVGEVAHLLQPILVYILE